MVASAALMNPFMTGCAERHQIALVMCAAVREWTYVMHECREDVSPPLLAALTKWMRCQMAVTNPTPRASVSLVLIVATRKMLVMSLHDFLVRLTVATLSVRQVRAARHAAGTFRLSRHCTSPSKSPRGELLLREG